MKSYKQVQKEILKELNELWENRELEPNEDKSDIYNRVDFERGALEAMLILAMQKNDMLFETSKNENSKINNN